MPDTPTNLLNLAALNEIKREAFREGWLACLSALRESMEEKSAPVFPVVVPEPPQEGSTQWVVLEAVKTAPGLNTADLLSRVAHYAHANISPSSARVALTRLKGKNLIVARENKWFPA